MFNDVKWRISKTFTGGSGKAYLFDKCINIEFGPEKEKSMMTGLHRVRSISCIQCKKEIGWTYVFAYSQSQKYKEGKFIVERAYVAKCSRQEEGDLEMSSSESEQAEPAQASESEEEPIYVRNIRPSLHTNLPALYPLQNEEDRMQEAATNRLITEALAEALHEDTSAMEESEPDLYFDPLPF
eukprot:CAMPEP_0170508202 /NCGR_PEP_ID=MMETSP0208-20121228/61578_1 /TAXON_ID=197538 /ORGANISM="Strombidium inclinatum, Strain S3" /LENGTH=182 /DNA_ID=CAMNT_0010790961 /DNA_START=42 /DNA_END=590 /DNA_ORIENTATION=-